MDKISRAIREVAAKSVVTHGRQVKTCLLKGELLEVESKIAMIHNSCNVLDTIVYKDGIIIVYQDKVNG